MSAGANPDLDSDPPVHADPADSSLITYLIKHGPKWLRTPARLIGFLVAAVPSLVLLFHLGTEIPGKIATSPAAKELQMAADADVSGRSATFQLLKQKAQRGVLLSLDEQAKLFDMGEEMDHQLRHQTIPNDDVKWITFAQEDKNDYFGYKLYPSDRCLLIARVEKGNTAKVEWLRDPVSLPAAIPPRPPGAAFMRGEPPLSLRHRDIQRQLLQNAAFQSERQGDDLPTLERIQAGCLNPHPWPYQQTVGAPINQCQSPVYRQWADGCMHVQIYDHCQNFWGPVVWQACAPNHHP